MIIEYDNFLTEAECNILIGHGESSVLEFGGILRSKKKIGYRKAKVKWFEENDFIRRIKDEVSRLSGIPVENQEDFHFVKYSEKGEYKTHHDGSFRIKTAMIYLNDGFSGGETYFPNIDRTIKPTIGKLIIWDNLDSNGDIDRDSYHAGLPVEFGTKYIGVIWIGKTKD